MATRAGRTASGRIKKGYRLTKSGVRKAAKKKTTRRKRR